MPPHQQQTYTDPRASGLFVQSNALPAGADEPGEGIPAMQGLVEGPGGEECGMGDTADRAQAQPSFRRVSKTNKSFLATSNLLF